MIDELVQAQGVGVLLGGQAGIELFKRFSVAVERSTEVRLLRERLVERDAELIGNHLCKPIRDG